MDSLREKRAELEELAREWVADCQWLEEPEDLEELEPERVRAGVEKHYAGGWAGFVRDAALTPAELEARQAAALEAALEESSRMRTEEARAYREAGELS
jgi:hypothetical protein